MAKFDNKSKSQYFAFVVFGEDAIAAAVNELKEDLIQFEYIVHDHDEGKALHAHFLLNYGNRTTLNWMIKSYGHIACNAYIKPINFPDKMDRYMVHDQTIDSAKGKYEYPEADMICINGFDRDNLSVFTESEKMFFMDAIMVYANDMKIYEYSGLLEFLSKHDRMCYRFALNNTICVNAYMSSHRNRNKKGVADPEKNN